jgi:hypothetical protein
MAANAYDDSSYRTIDEWKNGIGWIAYPDETMERASHAVVGNRGGVWIIDPVDTPEVDQLLRELGEVTGVVVCLDRHRRDAATVAKRHEVSVYIPSSLASIQDEIQAPTTVFEHELGDSGYRPFTIVNRRIPPWREAGLYHPQAKTAIIPESLGTASYFTAPSENLGVHPMLRLTPPRDAFHSINPSRILVGHGQGVFDDATRSLELALANSRKTMMRSYADAFKSLLA